MDLEQTAIERLKMASDMSLRLYKQPLVITYSGGKDSDVLLHLAGRSGIPYEVLHSLTTADAPETVWHVRDTLARSSRAIRRSKRHMSGRLTGCLRNGTSENFRARGRPARM